MTKPSETVRVDQLAWNRGAHVVQVIWDSWRNRDRTCRFKGKCVSCGRRTFGFDDGENDPRGMLGDHAWWPVDCDHDDGTHDVTLCALCANDEPSYRLGLSRHRRRTTRPLARRGVNSG